MGYGPWGLSLSPWPRRSRETTRCRRAKCFACAAKNERSHVQPCTNTKPGFPLPLTSYVSLVTGVGPRAHGVVSNHVLNRVTGHVEDFTGDPVYDAADLVRAPTFYDRAHAAGMRTAAIDWPATRHATSLDFNLPMFKNQKIFEAHTAPAVWKELGDLGYPV